MAISYLLLAFIQMNDNFGRNGKCLIYLLLVIWLTTVKWASISQVWLIQLHSVLLSAFFVDQWKLFLFSHHNRGVVPGFFVAMI